MTLLVYLQGELLSQDRSDLFSSNPTGYNLVMMAIYNLLRRAALAESDSFNITDKYISWLKDGQVIEQVFIGNSLTPTTFRDNLKLIVHYDEDVGKHLQLTSDSEELLAYNIT